jgi:hypothetical protein
MATNEAGKTNSQSPVLAKNEMHVTLTENKHEWGSERSQVLVI